MTLHAFDKSTNKSMKWASLPLELVDWMADHFDKPMIQHLGKIDPYNSVLLPESLTENASEEFEEVHTFLNKETRTDVPQVIEIVGNYGREGALATLKELVSFFEFASLNGYKVVSIGD